MFRSWSKEDRNHYGNSEVMQELEKSVIDTLKRLDILHKRVAAVKAPAVEPVDPAVGQSVDNLAASMDGLKSSLDGVNAAAASDGELDDADNESDDDIKSAVINDLRDLIKSAIEKDDISLAYKIERTIGEILEEEE